MKLAGSLLVALVVLTACVPRPVVLPPPPPPLPPPPPVAVETDAERTARAQQLWTSGTALGQQGRWAQAERAYREAVALQPDSVPYQLSLTTALLQQQRDSEAADVLLGAIRLQEAAPSPNHRLLAVDYERLIQILERVNRLDEARAARERQRLHRMLRDAQPPE
ncbi:Tetratricopeptide repeat-containing protein [bacterium JGI 053]|nr:Tetratricopeptide repeat-containing protein [bacterium JGI 053]